MYHAVAIRLSNADGCLTYKPPGKEKQGSNTGKGDRLLWDKEIFEDDLRNDHSVY